MLAERTERKTQIRGLTRIGGFASGMRLSLANRLEQEDNLMVERA